MNQIIDWSSKGNVVRFYLGENGKQWGDDWNDVPFECNAGTVYPEFIKKEKDISFPFDDTLIFADDGYFNSPFSKEDFIKREVPFLIVVSPKVLEENLYMNEFDHYMQKDFEGCKCFYFGDVLE